MFCLFWYCIISCVHFDYIIQYTYEIGNFQVSTHLILLNLLQYQSVHVQSLISVVTKSSWALSLSHSRSQSLTCDSGYIIDVSHLILWGS